MLDKGVQNEEPKDIDSCQCPICVCRNKAQPGLYSLDIFLIGRPDLEDKLPVCANCHKGIHMPLPA